MTSPVWVLEETVLRIHDAQIDEHGGAIGDLGNGLLQSALSHPLNLFNYSGPSIFGLAAAYAEGIIKNHPFIDGNKRTAYVVTRLFLRLNGFDLTASQEEKVIKFREFASNNITIQDFSDWIKINSVSLSIDF